MDAANLVKGKCGNWPKQKQKTQQWIWEWEVPRNGICFTECHQVLELTWHGEDTHEPDEQSASFTWRQKYALGTHIFAVPSGSWMKIPERCNQIQCCQNLLQDYMYLWYWYSKRNLGAFVLEVRLQSGSIDFNMQWFNNYYSRFTIAIIRISNNSSASIFLEAVHVCLLHANL